VVNGHRPSQSACDSFVGLWRSSEENKETRGRAHARASAGAFAPSRETADTVAGTDALGEVKRSTCFASCCDAAVLVRHHLAGFLERVEEGSHAPLPDFVQGELRGFAQGELRGFAVCGDFSQSSRRQRINLRVPGASSKFPAETA